MKPISALIILMGLTMGVSAQQSVELKWDNQLTDLTTVSGKVYKTLLLQGADLAGSHLPVYYHKEPIPSGYDIRVTIENAHFEPVINGSELDGAEQIKNEIEITSGVSFERKQSVAWYQMIPLRKNQTTGNIEKLVSFDVNIQRIRTQNKAATRGSQSYAQNSKLATGNWYKISTNENGIYRLDYNFLKSLGVDVDNIDPRNIRIFGNGGGMLPERTDLWRADDLKENAIMVTGESDGSFDPGDVILFYGESSTQWAVDTTAKGYNHQIHLYDNKAYYFLTTNLGTGKRIQTHSSLSLPKSFDVSEVDYLALEEKELYNLAKSGRVWYGDIFDQLNQLDRTYSFSVPNINSNKSVFIKVDAAGRNAVSGCSMDVYVNNQKRGTLIFGPINNAYEGDEAKGASGIYEVTGISSNVSVRLVFNPGSGDADARGWLNYIEVVARRSATLPPGTNQMIFHDRNAVGPGMIAEYHITSPAYSLWDITDKYNVAIQQYNHVSGQMIYRATADSMRKFIIFNSSGYLTAAPEGVVRNQNLHGTLGQPDLVIVTPEIFKDQAQRLADYHQAHDGYESRVVMLKDIYNEFSSGAKDATAIRDMMRMLYVRAGNDPNLMPRFLCLFGDGSYDMRNIQVSAVDNTDFVPTYQSIPSLNKANTFCSDDFYGLLDDGEGDRIESGQQMLDIAVGRLIVESTTEAREVVDKIIHYSSNQTYGSWRNVIACIGDDEDAAMHVDVSTGAEGIAQIMENDFPVYNVDKIYLDAYEQQSTPGGSRYPDVNKAISNRIFNGCLIMNYSGHGGESGWAHERVLSEEDFRDWENLDKLPVFVTATCSFSRYDNPETKAAGEKIFVKGDGGAIALVTTVRLVYAGGNAVLNKSFIQHAFSPVNGTMPTLGEALMNAKNSVFKGDNNRKFALLGDPALTMDYPRYNAVTTKIDNAAFLGSNDTIKALAKITINGEVRNDANQVMNGFNGIVYPTIYDKPLEVKTLRNDPSSAAFQFDYQKNIIYRGKASVTNGLFTYTFVVPKDIAYNFGSGKISYYANTSNTDAHGFDTVTIGGTADSISNDDKGPDVMVFMNDESFVFGGLTDESPLLLVKLSDDNGINTAGSAIGHDIAGTLDEDDEDKIVLNDFYEGALNDYRAGEVRYPMRDLKVGTHRILVRAWDTYNNPGEGYTEFVVAESAELALSHVLNYPNPFTTHTEFWFEHNRPGQMLDIQVDIYAVSGRLVKSIQQTAISDGYRVSGIEWDGLDEFGDPIGKGVYIYKLNVQASDGARAMEIEKLVLLR